MYLTPALDELGKTSSEKINIALFLSLHQYLSFCSPGSVLECESRNYA